MIRQVQVVFDRGVLKPVEPLDLEQNQHYLVTIQDEVGEAGVLDDIVELAQSALGKSTHAR